MASLSSPKPTKSGSRRGSLWRPSRYPGTCSQTEKDWLAERVGFEPPKPLRIQKDNSSRKCLKRISAKPSGEGCSAPHPPYRREEGDVAILQPVLDPKGVDRMSFHGKTILITGAALEAGSLPPKPPSQEVPMLL